MEHLWEKIKNKFVRGAKKYGKLLGVEDIDIFPWTLKKTIKWIFAKSFWSVKFLRSDASERNSDQKTAVPVKYPISNFGSF